MDSSRRAVESYWRSRMIDAATSDEDKVAPVYKLEEICDLLRSSHVSIVKEVSDFILKRLDRKSPIVKQKALRLIKYAVGKSGAEFRREMQRHSVAVRQLFHYKGQPDPLKGDALNKAVRDTAHEALSAIFSEETKSAPTEQINRRIQGFGNTNFEMPSEDKKSFLSEVVGIGSASIKQGISTLTQGHSFKKNDDSGNYKSPALRRSLTLEPDNPDKYEPVRLPNDSHGSTVNTSGHWAQDSGIMKMDAGNGESSSSHSGIKTREERLLETIVTSGGVRLQPTRDAVQDFLVEAAKLDALALTRAIESKLESPMWQVRMRAVCVLESILRKKNDGHFSVVASYFSENSDVVLRCSESPQSSLREKANKVLSLLDVEHGGSPLSISGKSMKNEVTVDLAIPNLIDTVDLETDNGAEDVLNKQGDQSASISTSQDIHVSDLFGGDSVTGINANEQKTDEDPFKGVSFHSNEGNGITDDLFTGMSVAAKLAINGNHIMSNQSGSELVDIFGANTEPPSEHENSKKDVIDLMDEFSLNGNPSEIKTGTTSESSGGILWGTNHASNQLSSKDALIGMPGIQGAGLNTEQMLPFSAIPYNIPHGMMLNPAFFPEPMNYGAMGGFFTQQQLLAAMSNLQQFGNLNSQNAGVNNVAGIKEVYGSPLPDIFQSKYPSQTPSSLISNSQKEDSRAFDFISDHLSAARGSKGGS